MHPNSIENLKRGKKFGSGQPTSKGGAPQGKRLSTWLREIGEQGVVYKDLDGEFRNMPVKKALALALVAKALQDHDVKALQLLLGYYASQEHPTHEEPLQIDKQTLGYLTSIGIPEEAIFTRCTLEP